MTRPDTGAVFLMRTAAFNEHGIFDDEAHAQVNRAADLMTSLLRRSGATIATGEAYKLRKTAFYLDQALKDRAVDTHVYEGAVSSLIEETRLSPDLSHLRRVVEHLKKDRALGRVGLGGLIIVTSEYPIEALRNVQEEELYTPERIAHGGVVLAHPEVL